MKNLLPLFALTLLATTPALAGIDHDIACDLFAGDNISIHIDAGDLTIEHDGETVEFTDDAKLIVNGDKVDLDRKQRRMVGEFHNDSMELIDSAKDIGIEGAKIGLEGVRLAISALAGVVKLLDSDYDSDDLERDIEAKAEKLEEKAEKLEEVAEKIEDKADDLEDLADDLRDEIPELDELGWF